MQKNKTEILIQKYLSHQLNEQEFEELKQWIETVSYTHLSLPFKMDKVEQPTFPDYSVNIIDFGAKPDGITLNTKAINDACF